MNSYQNLISKLDTFIKKYYKIKIVRGIIIFITLLPVIWLIVSYSEFYLRFSQITRTIIFYTLLTLFISFFIYQIVIPALKIFKIGKVISYKDAAKIISKHFPEIQDKLLNILELQERKKNEKNVLIEASILQKTEQIKLIPFTSAVKYSQLKKYIKYTVPVLLIFISAFLISPGILKEGTKHIINYKKEFKKPPPFHFILKNKNLNFKKGENVRIKLKIKGKYLPDEVFINYGRSNFLMTKEKNSKTEFYYDFKNIYNSVEFFFSADNLKSEKFKINILPVPSVLEFYLKINVPEYTGEKDTILKNVNDIVIPYGSVIKWNFIPDNSDSLYLISKNKKETLKKQNNNFVYKKTYYKTNDYYVTTKNKHFTNDSILHIKITTIPDLYPIIQVNQIKDTANFFISYFKGFINDDYGIKKLLFKFRKVDKNTDTNDKSTKFITNNLPFSHSELRQIFYYVFNFYDLNIKENQKVQYYFEVWDNDAVSGSKKTKTQIFTFEIPSQKEIDNFEALANENINSKIEKSISLAEEIKKEIRNLRERNLEGNISDWENKQMLQNILNKQNLLQKLTEEIAQENKQKNLIKKRLSEKDKELLKKQEEIQKLLEEVMTDELKKLMKQLEELQNKFNKKLMEKLLKENEFSYKEMSERLDRTKELLKREQVQQKINKTIDRLKKLSEEQKELSEKTKQKSLSKEELLKKQQEIKENFNDAMKEYNDAKKINEELKNKMKLDDFEKEKKEIEEEFQKSKENLQKERKNKASDSQNKNSENIKKTAEKMENMMSANSMEQKGEDMEALRKILDNLINFSFKQEKLINEIRTTKNTDPKMMSLFEEQSNMKEDFEIIEDSLKALGYRIPQINKTITDEIYEISSNLSAVTKKLQDRKVAYAAINQNKVMTSTNNLALLLSEILNQMKNSESSGSGSGKGSKKPKNGKQKAMQDLKGMQESLKKQMEQLLKQMKDGQGGLSKDAQTKQLAKMLAQQEIFKQMLKEMQSGFSLNPETKKLLNEIQKMSEENKKDIINRKITPELINRQKKIETRLLEAEKAENKRKFDKKRESETPENKIYKSPKDIFNNQKNNTIFDEDLYKRNIQLRKFYKQLYNEYYKSINN